MISIHLGVRQVKIENKGHYWQRRYNFHKGRRTERDREREGEGKNGKRRKANIVKVVSWK